MDNLFLVQFFCCIIMGIVAFQLFLCSFSINRRNKYYEKSRWLLFSAYSLLCVHFALQMIFRFREQGNDVAAIINILFYVPAALFVCYARYNLELNSRALRSFFRAGSIAYGLILFAFVSGWFVYKSLHMPHAIHTMAAIFIAFMMYAVWIHTRELKNIPKLIENETGIDILPYRMYLRMGSFMMIFVTLIIPFSIYFRFLSMLVAVPLVACLLVFAHFFIVLGYNMVPMAEVIENVMASQDESEHPLNTPDSRVLSENDVLRIKKAIDLWVKESGYRNSDTTISSMARRTGISHAELTRYISQEHGSTFRIWLSNLRMEESKKILLEHMEYSIETVAQECGFSSASHFHRFFHNATGMTPTEYRKSRN